MKSLIQTIKQTAHRMVIHWQIRSLDAQARSIVEARADALMQLMEIRRERQNIQLLIDEMSQQKDVRLVA